MKAPHKGPTANSWFRYYSSSMHDPKVQGLSSDVFRTWVNLLCMASEGNGGLPPVKDIAFTLRLSPRSAESHVSKLIAEGLLDLTGDDDAAILTPHNWAERQFVSDTSTDRVRKFRERKLKQHDAANSPDDETELKRFTKRGGNV